MHMVTGPRSTASDQPRSPPAASTARYDAGLDPETERIRHRFQRCKRRRASQGPCRATRAAEASGVPRGPRKSRFAGEPAQTKNRIILTATY